MSKPVIGVIGGTGAEGSGLVVRWAAAGYPVIIGSRSREKAQTVAAELTSLLPAGGVEIRGEDNAGAAAAGDVIVLSVPYSSQAEMAAQIAEGAQGKVVITVVVPLKPPRVSVAWRPEAGSAAEELQRQLGENVQVVAAFQNIAAAHLRDLSWQPDCDVLYTGDKKEAKAVALELIRAAGFFGVDAGPLANSSVVEGLTAVLIGVNLRYKVQGSGIRITGIPR
ncbi:MAG: NADPH-dependent F420 reductase [Caldilinea sp.]|nr:NADPH-dependent F420 reductase [Caldilinea sp.]MDW8441978.1 NADPH-dependent F420 reductase [Caldilineaceae bacterium]